MKTVPVFDIVIVGGGMVGMTLALTLQASGARIALMDATPLADVMPNRLIALNGSSCDVLKRIGLEAVLAARGAPIKKIHVSCKGHFGSVCLSADEMGYRCLGCVIPEKYIVQRLSALLLEADNVTLYRPERLTALQQEEGAGLVTLSTEERLLQARRVIGADGTHSTVRALLNIKTQLNDYHQSALVGEVSLSRAHEGVAYERFQASGAIAMLPLQGSQVAMIWTAPVDVINRLKMLNETDFLQELQTCFGYRLGRFQRIAYRATYPLLMQEASQQIKGRVLLLGNAAHTLHPIAAQGLNLALYEVAQLSDYLLSPAYQEDGFEGFSFKERQVDFSRTLSHGLTKLFSASGGIVSGVRSMGMLGFDLCSFAKSHFARYAMGLAK